MALAVRIWATESKPNTTIKPGFVRTMPGSLGGGSPWVYEPSWDGWHVADDPRFSDDPDGVPGDFTKMADLSRLELAELNDKVKRAGKVDPEVARVVQPSSPFSRFMVYVYEWESGLDGSH
jgi:hypothetical protein